jgi:hypothetical protein
VSGSIVQVQRAALAGCVAGLLAGASCRATGDPPSAGTTGTSSGTAEDDGPAGTTSSDDAPATTDGGASTSDDAPTSGADESTDDAGTTDTGARPDCDAGPPVDAPPDEWTWVEVEGTSCALAGTAGFAINPTNASSNVLVALEGGGACFSQSDCESSRLNGIDAFDLLSNLPELRLFDRGIASNPFADYSFFFVPYCTGDFHSGDNVTDWGASHVGFANMRSFLDRIVPTFCDAEHVVLTGFSAGGFGATFNYAQVHEAFGSTAVDLVDDSGPYMAPPWMPSDMQADFDAAWGFRANMPADCTDCASRWDALYPYVAQRWPDDRMSLVSARYDYSIQERFAPYTPLATLEDFAIAIDALADEVLAPLPNVRVFYIEDNGHVYLPSTPLDELVVNGTSLEAFLRAQLDDDPGWSNVRP